MTTCVRPEIINKLLFLSTAMHTSPPPLIILFYTTHSFNKWTGRKSNWEWCGKWVSRWAFIGIFYCCSSTTSDVENFLFFYSKDSHRCLQICKSVAAHSRCQRTFLSWHILSFPRRNICHLHADVSIRNFMCEWVKEKSIDMSWWSESLRDVIELFHMHSFFIQHARTIWGELLSFIKFLN